MKTDIMFVVGLITALLWCGAQAEKAFTTVEGVSLAQYIAFCGGFYFQLALAIEARKKDAGRIISQQIVLFGAWCVCGALLIAVVMTRGTYHWSSVDWTITRLALAGVVGTLIWAIYNKKAVSDAVVRALMNISLKSLPQFLLIMKIWSEGSAGITTTAIVLGHVSIVVRLINMSSSMKTEGMNRDKTWLFMSDVINLVSWFSVTVVWLMK